MAEPAIRPPSAAGKPALLFEIIYPENRVVVDYGPREDLTLVGVRDRFTREDYFYPPIAEAATRFGFSIPEAFTFTSIDAMLDAAAHLAISRERVGAPLR